MRRTQLLLIAIALSSCRADKVPMDLGDSSIDDTDAAVDADEDQDGFFASEDCDDTDPLIHPNATELCDEIDNDCDEEIDEADAEDAPTWYLDSDGDGFGDESEALVQCDEPSGYVTASKSGFDCDDADGDFYPGADESDCTDPNDYNCDGSVAYADADEDGWAACEECDDADSEVHPDATESCNEIDDDCDGLTDEEDPDLSDASTWYIDYDGDGFGDPDSAAGSCEAPSGYVEDDTDCDDTNASNFPGADEYCDGEDNDCDGETDESDAIDGSTWYMDGDGDGYGVDSSTTVACDEPSGYVSNSSDCDDTDATVFDDNGASSSCAGTSCLDLLDAGHSSGDRTYWIDPDGSGSVELYCDMSTDDGGWTLVGVAIYGNHGSSGWNDESSLNIGSSNDLDAHWHLSSDLMNTLAESQEYRAVCFDSSNNYTRYWWGVSDYNWANLSSASESWDSYDQSGSSYATYWAAHHYGLVSGDNETDTLITAHTDDQWACAGLSGPGGEGYTGRGGVSNFRLWAK